LNLRDLHYLIALAETRHFGQASQRCFVSQPTLSGQIKKLEQDLGVIIFERNNRSVEITPAGEAILKHARLIMEQAEAIKQLALSYKDPTAWTLRIGAIPTISPYLMPLILRPLQTRYPKMRLIISEEQTDTLLQRLKNHEIDTAILATQHPEMDFKSLPLYTEPFWLAYPPEHPLYHKDEITQQDLDNTELLLLAEGHCLAQQAMQACHLTDRNRSGEMANLRASSLETLLQLVAVGYGTTLIPALCLTGSWVSGRGVITRELNLAHTWRQISLFHRPSYPGIAALQALVEVIKGSLPNTVKIL
jgi:LysR family hydrogen peroxide-inducible transcriptional activator